MDKLEKLIKDFGPGPTWFNENLPLINAPPPPQPAALCKAPIKPPAGSPWEELAVTHITG